MNLCSRIVVKGFSAFSPGNDRSVASRTRFAIVPRKQMPHQLINFPVLAASQLGIL
jgi:hypothetical protein